MKVRDGRGFHTKATAIKNKNRVKEWFENNPNSTTKECGEALKLSVATVRKHIRDLMDE